VTTIGLRAFEAIEVKCHAKGLTVAQLCATLGWSRSTPNRWQRGTSPMYAKIHEAHAYLDGLPDRVVERFTPAQRELLL